MTATLSQTQLSDYASRGLILVDVPSDVRPFQLEFLEEIATYLKHWHGIDTVADGVPAALADLQRANSQAVGKLMKVSERFPGVRRLASSAWAVDLASELMGSNLISCASFLATRFDPPLAARPGSPPHQDFPYIQGSLDGITIWFPFLDMSSQVGPPAFIPGSHQQGVGRVREYVRNPADRVASVQALQEDEWRNAAWEFEEVRADQALAFSTLLVHRSQPNTSKVMRISAQLRFDNLCDRESFERNFPDGLFGGQNLSDNYPELVQGH